MTFVNSSVKDFMEKAVEKINGLKCFTIFQEDINKPAESDNTEMNLNIEKIVMSIKIKEEILEKNYTLNMVRELMNLYQKVIEILSAKNDESFRFYLEKLHKLLKKEEIQNHLHTQQKTKAKKKSDTFKISDSTFSIFNAIKVEE